MARNKVLERAKVSAPVGRNEFDVSALRNFTAFAGYLNLVFAQPVIAGTHGRINRAVFTRTADVVSPAFPKVTQHLDFFIVPLRSIWSYFENFKLNINDLKSSSYVSFDSQAGQPVLTVPSYMPTFDFGIKVSGTSPNLVRSSAPDRVFPVPQNPTADEVDNVCVHRNNMLRLCEAAGYGRIVSDPTAPPTSSTSNVQNLAKLAAYQKCYFEHYRNTAYESNDPYAYNLDWVSQAQLAHIGGIIDPTTASGKYVMQQLCTMRKVNYRNDYFHNIYPAINYVLSSPAGTDFSIPGDLGGILLGSNSSAGSVGVVGAKGVYNNSGNYQRGGVVTGAVTESTSVGISVQSIRAAFALDKLMRASAYAPKHVKEQWKAQFGVDIPEDSDMMSRRLGSFQNDVIFQEVTQMAPFSNTQLGDLGAKGQGSGNLSENIDFYAQYDSIIIGIQYFMPRSIYDAFGLNIWNVNRARGDFYSRFFENLGLRPIYQKELDSIGYVRQSGANPNTVVGFSVPNQILKLGQDLNLCEFKDNFIYYDPNDDQDDSVASQTTSYLKTFTVHNTSVLKLINGGLNMSAEYFKVQPEDLDPIFRQATPTSHKLGYFQFYGQLLIRLFISAAMGVHGQPHL